MDRMGYIAMTGAKQTLIAQGIVSNNIANASTTGFRADMQRFSSEPVYGDIYPSRVNAQARSEHSDLSQGALIETGGELDIAIQGSGWLAVQARDGSEAYTRAGDLRITELGQLTTGAGHPVVGDGGPVAIPPGTGLTVGADGTVSIVPLGQTADTVAVVDRLKLVNPPHKELAKGLDGLFRLKSGDEAPASADVSVAQGALESSNVNAAGALVDMIRFSRQFETQVKLIREARQNADASTELMRVR